MSLSAHDVAPATISGNGIVTPPEHVLAVPMDLNSALDEIVRLNNDLAITRVERDLWKSKAEELGSRWFERLVDE